MRARRDPSSFSGGQAAALGSVRLQGGINRMRRGLLDERGADGPVSVACPLQASVDVMPHDVGEDDWVPVHDLVLPVPGRQVEEPRKCRGFPPLTARRPNSIRPVWWQVISNRQSLAQVIETRFDGTGMFEAGA
jgi:hypothetical protein